MNLPPTPPFSQDFTRADLREYIRKAYGSWFDTITGVRQDYDMRYWHRLDCEIPGILEVLKAAEKGELNVEHLPKLKRIRFQGTALLHFFEEFVLEAYAKIIEKQAYQNVNSDFLVSDCISFFEERWKQRYPYDEQCKHQMEYY
ncbi:uncharacterized protein J8A68_003998 [[Candida] subhashii]|uniref:Uncharacterized protein n=1 Tax=[Candida] subhashii TaxID=561895 RepID=A0A8J5QL53_9ASCO|nr:uncharacterized protein J8A68_003998 [[Candida] subhashii]KAG7662467.1 hypothetical protein J8A68_003998 [[Candida] subhashii]